MLTTHGRKSKNFLEFGNPKTGAGKAALTGCRYRRCIRRSRSSCTRTAAPGSWTNTHTHTQTTQQKAVSSKSSTNSRTDCKVKKKVGKTPYDSVAVDASAVGRQLEEPPHDPLVPLLLLPGPGRHRARGAQTAHCSGRRRGLDPPCPSAESRAGPGSAISASAEPSGADAGIESEETGAVSFCSGEAAAEARRVGVGGVVRACEQLGVGLCCVSKWAGVVPCRWDAKARPVLW
jgi:hypothetical protein